MRYKWFIIFLLPLLFAASENTNTNVAEMIKPLVEERRLSAAAISPAVIPAIVPTITPKTMGVIADAPTEPVAQPGLSYKFLIIGDSFVAKNGGVGEPLEDQLLNFDGVSVKRLGVVSSGLIDANFFNWYKGAKKLFEKNKPDFVIILLGNNDVKPIKIKTSGGEVADFLEFGTEDWNEAYQKKVRDFLKIFEKEGVKVYWLGLSMMRDKNFNTQIENLNNVISEEIKNHKNVRFVPTWDLLSDGRGNYAQYLPDAKGNLRKARFADGIHLTQFSGGIVTNELVKDLSSKLKLLLKNASR